MKRCLLIISTLLVALGCGGEQNKKVENKYDFYDNLMETRPEDSDGKDKKTDDGKKKENDKKENGKESQPSDSGVEEPLIDPIMADEAMELEELEMEDNDALTALISERLSSPSQKKKTTRYNTI